MGAMAVAEEQTESGEGEDYKQRPWVKVTPTTRLKGVPTEIFVPFQFDGSDAQPDMSFGLVLRDPEVIIGSLHRNAAKPEDGVTRERVDEDSSNPTDYRVADGNDPSVTVIGDTLASDEESTVDGEPANEYPTADAFDEDEILVWLSGIAGQKIVRALDFNGRPYARYTENDDGEPYLIKGLLQQHSEWMDADDGATRGELAGEGKAPRLARPPVLRPDVEDIPILLDVTANDSGRYRSYVGNVFDAESFDAEFGGMDTPTEDLPTGQYGIEADSRFGLRQASFDEADATVAEQNWSPHTFFRDGNGWGDQPDDVGDSSSFTVSVGTTGDATDTDQDDRFAQTVIDNMNEADGAHGKTPDEALNPSLAGLVDKNADEWETPPTGERLDAIRETIYAELPWLSTEDLE